jgi:Asp/Glu/hydantoin racemase
MTDKKRIVLLHATPVAMEPIQAAFQRLWPEAETVNLMDDSLTIDRAKSHNITEDMIDRLVELGRYANKIHADAILVTCSAFGPAIDQLVTDLSIPVLKPNEAMFRTALALGKKIGMLATFKPSVKTMTDEFQQFLAETGSQSQLDTIVVENAIDLLRAGNVEQHNNLVAARAPDLADKDVVMLAHFSTSRAADAVSQRIKIPVLTAPDAAVLDLRKKLGS